VLVVQVGLSVNLASLTIDQVVAKRRNLVKSLASNMESDLRKKLMQAGDGHYDHEQRPIGCHVCGTSPIRGTRYEIHSVKWSVCRKCAVECGADPDEKVMIFSEKLPGEEKKATAYYVLPAWSDFPGEVETRALMLGVMAERMSAAYDFEWYNVDSNFAGMLQSVIDLKIALSKAPTIIYFNRISHLTSPWQLAPELWHRCATSLVVLRLCLVENLTELPEEIGDLKALEFLNLDHQFKMTKLPSRLGECTKLKKIKMWKLHDLKSMPDLSGLAGQVKLDPDLEHVDNLSAYIAGGMKAWTKV